MLQDYIENFANSLGVKPEDQAKIEAEALTGDYTITLNDKLVCSIGETPAPDGGSPVLRFSVAFCGSEEDERPQEDDLKTLLNKYAEIDARLLESPLLGRASLVLLPDRNIIGLRTEFKEEGLTPEMFNRRLFSFAKTALLISKEPEDAETETEPEDDSEDSVLVTDQDIARARSAFRDLLARMDMNEEMLQESLNRLELSPDFGTRITFKNASGCLVIENSLPRLRLTPESMAKLITENVTHQELFQFSCRYRVLSLEQILDLTAEDQTPDSLAAAFEEALGKQKLLVEKLLENADLLEQESGNGNSPEEEPEIFGSMLFLDV
ncbi:MAG: hypothetical protein VZR11_07190 [Succinimonas sp.]|nr:hypothetical protein [Succinimonas sp.]